MGQATRTLAELSQMISQNPTDAWAFANRGEVYRSNGCYAEALADLGRAIDLKPSFAWALAHRGVIYKSMRRYAEALVDLNEAISLKPNYAWALIHRADIYITVQRYGDALTDMDRAIALNCTIVPYWRGERGLILNFLGRYAETVACCEQALQEDPDDYIASYSLTVAMNCGQEATAALTVLNKTWHLLQSAQRTNPVPAGVLYRLGGLAALQGKREEALGYLQDAVVCSDEPRETARHDPAWLALRADPHFQALTTVDIF